MIFAVVTPFSVFGIVGAVACLIGAVGAIAASVFRSSSAAGTIAILKTNAEAQEARAVEAERSLAVAEARITALEARVTNAEQMASGTKAVEALGRLISKQHIELLDAIKGRT